MNCKFECLNDENCSIPEHAAPCVKETAIHRGVFRRVNGGDALRTDSIDGIFFVRPKVGQRFHLLAEPLDPKMSARSIITSMVKSINHTGTSIIIETENSTYELIENKESAI